MDTDYESHVLKRQAMGIPPLPLSAEQTRRLVDVLQRPDAAGHPEWLTLLTDRVSPGVDPAAEVKALFLGQIAAGEATCPLISRRHAVTLLGTMLGGYNLEPLLKLLDDDTLAEDAAYALARTLLIFDVFDDVQKKSASNEHARRVMESWAAADWFLERPALPAEIRVVVYKVDGEINTDDLSPATEAVSRPDIPLHALAMGMTRFPDGIARMQGLKRDVGLPVAFAGDVVGTGSSRKSAANSLIWHIGDDIPYVPNKRRGGVVLGGKIAPIFFNTCEDSGALPIECDVGRLKTGDIIRIRPHDGVIIHDGSGETVSTFTLRPDTLSDEYRAGGRINLIIGRRLTERARAALNLPETSVFLSPGTAAIDSVGFTLAQKIVGKACGMAGVHPGTACLPVMTTVGSQDTTGPMTADELNELANLRFSADFVLQSFCHTAAAPKPADKDMHRRLPGFFTRRGGVALKPGDGVIHSWLNRFLIPDTVGTGGDSHTRFPVGISFPAGSGLVAFAAALGVMPLEMPESVLVEFTGTLNAGITIRDAVNAIALTAIRQGLLTVDPNNKKNVFNGRILEMRGLPDLKVEQAFEMTDASAERSAAAATFELNPEPVIEFLRSNVVLIRKMIDDGYQDANTLQRRIDKIKAWLAAPDLLRADEDAQYAETLTVKLDEITEPILACPNNPDDVKPLSALAGQPVDEVFIGSCMTNIGHYRAASRILKDVETLPVRLWFVPPTRMDQERLRFEGVYEPLERLGAMNEIPGCSLCMGNQKRTARGAVVFSTSTRNFPNRMGDDTLVYLGSAELAAVTAMLGRIPTCEEYMDVYEKTLAGAESDIYRYLEFDKLDEYADAKRASGI